MYTYVHIYIYIYTYTYEYAYRRSTGRPPLASSPATSTPGLDTCMYYLKKNNNKFNKYNTTTNNNTNNNNNNTWHYCAINEICHLDINRRRHVLCEYKRDMCYLKKCLRDMFKKYIYIYIYIYVLFKEIYLYQRHINGVVSNNKKTNNFDFGGIKRPF